jgi:anti-sigma factor RsiW
MTAYNDETLRRYLGGDLTADDAVAIEAAVAGDADLERRLMALDPFAKPVRDTFAPLPGEDRVAAYAPVAAPLQKPLREQRWAIVMAACIAGAMIGYGFSGFAPKPTDWRTEVAHSQALYTTATISTVTSAADEVRNQLAAASEAVGAPLPLATLQNIAGMRLIRAQVLGYNGIPLAQIVFEGPNGTPIALCVLRGGGNGDMEQSTRQGLASTSWSKAGDAYLLIGGQDQAGIAAAAEIIRAQLGGV